MMLSRARPLALRTLTRQQRALSAAPQPVYEPHVVLHQRRDQTPTADAGRRTTGHGVGPDISKPPATPPPRRQNSSTLSDAAAATPEQLDAAAATPE